jgi:hypothetical protein
VSIDAAVDASFLERRRRLALRGAAGGLIVAVIGFAAGMAVGGSETTDTIGGAFLFAGIAGAIAAPWIVRAWQSFMRRQMVPIAVANRPDIRHIDSERDRRASEAALSSAAFSLGAFHDSGLVETFQSATVQHVLTGSADGVPFAIAEIALLDGKQYQMFNGVLASFRLARPRAGLTIVARDHGVLGNLLASAGGAIERLPLEDPDFENVFEVYGDDPVGGRVVLTTTMLERLKALDDLAHARGFACAFRGEHLLIAFSGMNWRCPASRILQPTESWTGDYGKWLTGLVDLPKDIVRTLNLASVPVASAAPFVADAPPSVAVDAGPAQVFSSSLWRLVGEGGKSLAHAASGLLFGGVALLGAYYGVTEGYSKNLFWYFWGIIAAGLVYGVYAVAVSARQLARLVWRWNAPLRTLNRP